MTARNTMEAHLALPEEEAIFVTMRVNNQLFGVDVRHVRDVLRNQHITPIPLAPPDVAGSLNSRGRIVTVLDVRRRLGLPPLMETQKAAMFVVVDVKGELYSLLVDDVGEVLTLPTSRIESVPANLTPEWKTLSSGIHRLDGELLVLINLFTFLHMD